MCRVVEDVYVCDDLGCMALGSARSTAVRRNVATFLNGASEDCQADVALVMDALLTFGYEDGHRPVTATVMLHPIDEACWIVIAGCSAEAGRYIERKPASDLTFQLLDHVCTGWGSLPGDDTHTLWAQLPLIVAQRETSEAKAVPMPRAKD